MPKLHRLRRVKWGAIGLTALFLAIVEAYYYFLRGVPLIDDLVDWLIGMTGAVVLAGTTRSVGREVRCRVLVRPGHPLDGPYPPAESIHSEEEHR